MKMKKLYFLIVLFLCGLSVKNGFAAAPTADRLGRELVLVAMVGDEATVKDLIAARADVNAVHALGTPLMHATRIGNENIVKRLLDAGANVDYQDNTGRTALMSAAVNGYTNIVKLLLSYEANKDLIDHFDNTAESLARGSQYDDHDELANYIRDYGLGRSIKFAGKKGKEEKDK